LKKYCFFFERFYFPFNFSAIGLANRRELAQMLTAISHAGACRRFLFEAGAFQAELRSGRYALSPP
jgi:hypothetical protein